MQTPYYTIGSSNAHKAAIDGNSEMMVQLLKENPELVNARDINGWTPLHVSLHQNKDVICINIFDTINHLGTTCSYDRRQYVQEI
jgi:ankyrin repeat protein